MISNINRMFALFFLLLLCAVVNAKATCINYKDDVQQAINNFDYKQLEQLSIKLNNDPSCTPAYIEYIERNVSEILAIRADELVQIGQLTDAENILQRAPTNTWLIQAVRGDIASNRKDWLSAAAAYNLAYDLIDDKTMTPVAPNIETIEKVFNSAAQAQVLSQTLDGPITRSGTSSGIFRGTTRGWQPKSIPIPITFEFDSVVITLDGEKSAKRLLAYIKAKNFSKISFEGHTDERGSIEYNQELSTRRAEALKKYIINLGYNGQIATIGKGESKPVQLDNSQRYSKEEIYRLNRRVEFFSSTMNK